MDILNKLNNTTVTLYAVAILAVIIILYIMWGIGKSKGEKLSNIDSSIIRTGGNSGGAVLNLVETTQPGQGPQENVYRPAYAKWWTGRTLETFNGGDDMQNFLQFKTPAGDKIGAFKGGITDKIGNEERSRLASQNMAAYERCLATTGSVDQCSVQPVDYIRQQLASTLNPTL